MFKYIRGVISLVSSPLNKWGSMSSISHIMFLLPCRGRKTWYQWTIKKIKKKYEKATYFLWVDWEDNYYEWGAGGFCFALTLFYLLFFFLIFHVPLCKMVRKLIIILFFMERNIQYAGAKPEFLKITVRKNFLLKVRCFTLVSRKFDSLYLDA